MYIEKNCISFSLSDSLIFNARMRLFKVDSIFAQAGEDLLQLNL